MKAGSLTDNIHTEHFLLLYLSSHLPVVQQDAIVQPVFCLGVPSCNLGTLGNSPTLLLCPVI